VKILTISCEYPPIGGGGATACQGLAEALVRASHEVVVVTSRMHGLSSFEERNGVQIHRVGGIRRRQHHSTAAEQLTQLIPTYRRAMELVRAHYFDLLHCHFVVPGGLVGYHVWRRTGLPYVITAHGSDIPSYNPHRFRLLHRLIRPLWTQVVDSSSALSVPSEFLKGLVAARTRRNIAVIPNPFDPPPQGEGQPGRRVLVVTRMVKRKGVQHLLEALADLETSWEFLMVGDGPYLKYLKRSASAIKAKVRFLGFVPRDELPELYQSARVFVFPSLRENFPMVLLEAMAAGCAVLTTSAPGCAEVVGDAAVLVDPGNSIALGDALGRLLADDAAIEGMRAASRQRVRQFASASVADQFNALFQSSCASWPSGSSYSVGSRQSIARW
jgi:glycosyltransferase involved in cell wall biosynthesis